MRLLLAKLVAAACLLIACVLYASPEHLESSVRMEQLFVRRHLKFHGMDSFVES